MWSARIRRSNSLVVNTRSTPCPANSPWNNGFSLSSFFARHGMIDNAKIRSGSMSIFFANAVFITAPNISCGDLADDNLFAICGYWDLINLTHPGQQDVNIGYISRSPFVNLSTNSVPSSMIVRSAENVVSNT